MRQRTLRPLALATFAAMAACTPDADRGAPSAILDPGPPALDVRPLAATTAWYQSPGGVAVAVDAAENVYTARWDYNPAGDIYLAKRDVNGNLLWEVRYDNTDNTRHEVATWVETDAGGNIFVSGTIRSGYSNPVNANSLLMKFSPSGQLLWRQVYGNPFDGSSTRKMLVDAAGNAYVFGLGMSPAPGLVSTVRKYAPNGALVWTWFDAAGIGAPLNIKWGLDGSLVMTCRGIYGSINGYARIDSNGNTLWSLPGVLSLSAGDAAADAAGNVYIVNGNYTTGSGSYLRKFAPTGQQLWQRGSPVTGIKVEVGTDQGAVISGYPTAGYGAAFSKFDAAGNLKWQNLDADGATTNLLAHGMLMLDASDNAYLAASNMSQMGVVKVFGATGTTDWLQLIPFGYAVDLAFGQAGRIYVTGGTVARIDQEGAPPPPPPPPPPPVNTAPVVTISAVSGTSIRRRATFTATATVVDPDVTDSPWPYTWHWGNGTTTGAWTAPGTFTASRTYTKAGQYQVRVVVTDARGAADTSNVIVVTVR